MAKVSGGPLVWIDMEMTGLNPDTDHIIEVATIVTDRDLNILEEGPNLIIHRDASDFEKMDDWNRKQHTKSGLWQQVIDSELTVQDAEEQTLNFIKKHCKPKASPLCGNSVWQDRRFIYRYMQNLDAHLHYRIVDVSTIKELAGHWYPKTTYNEKEDSHRALDDIRQSIRELKFYRENFFKKSE